MSDRLAAQIGTDTFPHFLDTINRLQILINERFWNVEGELAEELRDNLFTQHLDAIIAEVDAIIAEAAAVHDGELARTVEQPAKIQGGAALRSAKLRILAAEMRAGGKRDMAARRAFNVLVRKQRV